MRHVPDETATSRAPRLAGDLRVVIGRLNRRLREQSGADDLTQAQKSALLRLDHDGEATVTALAKAEGVRPQSMGATVAALQEMGLVGGRPHATDGRQTLLSLTPKCVDWLQAGRAARQDWMIAALTSALSSDEQAQLAMALPLLRRLADVSLSLVDRDREAEG
jgi:DNA-binding MarR family transcriptional regulator